MYKIAVIGDRDSVMGFKTLGLDVFPAENAETARKILHDLAKEGCAVVYMTEQMAVRLEADIARYRDNPIPAIILIPGKEGSLGIGLNGISRTVERAIGSDIL